MELEKYSNVFSFANEWIFKGNFNIQYQVFSLCLLSLKRFTEVFGDAFFFFLFACNLLKYELTVICFLYLQFLCLFFFLLSHQVLTNRGKQKNTSDVPWQTCCIAYFTLFYFVDLSSEVTSSKKNFSNLRTKYERISYAVLDKLELINKCIHISAPKIKLR